MAFEGNIFEEGTIGNLSYAIIENDDPDDINAGNNFHVMVDDGHHSWEVANDSGLIACQAFVAGMAVGRTKRVLTMHKKGLGYSEHCGVTE